MSNVKTKSTNTRKIESKELGEIKFMLVIKTELTITLSTKMFDCRNKSVKTA